MNPIRRVYNLPESPGTIYNFEWKNGVMKSRVIYMMGTIKDESKTGKMDLKTFVKFTDDLKKEMNLIGPWLGRTLVYRCRPKIEWSN